MDFALQTRLYKATEYFNEEVTKIYVRRNCKISQFNEFAHNPKGGRAYYLSSWALMGLQPDDYLIRGQVDLPDRPGWKAQPNYKHGWIQFLYQDDWFIYDPLESHVWEQNHWEEVHKPHNITFNLSQKEILTLALKDEAFDNAHQINDYIYQFKNPKKMDLPYNSENDGFLRDTLGGSQIHYAYGKTSYFLAENRS